MMTMIFDIMMNFEGNIAQEPLPGIFMIDEFIGSHFHHKERNQMNAQGSRQDKVAMSEGYWDRWNDEVQARIDRDIEANRKADAAVVFDGIPAGAEVKVEQLDHAFVFGAHIFNFNQLGADELNARYKDLYGSLFNSATIPFYWRRFEPEEGKPRFAGEYRDTADYWNAVKEPKKEPHWRRPATDPVVEFCEGKGIRLHGHTLVWGNSRWHMPEWLLAKLPVPYREQILPFKEVSENASAEIFDAFTPAQIETLLPEFARELNVSQARRIFDIALRYKGRLHSWDVVNESARDFEKGRMIPNDGICKSWYGLMPGDYTYRAFKLADSVFPKETKLNINDYTLGPCYPDQVRDLLARGCKIDIMGAQMHLFDPKLCQAIADGAPDARQSPEDVWKTMDCISAAGLPLHLSEITITAPGNDARGQAIQANITRNLYRLWFSLKAMMGITWWNVVDDCGAPGEPSVSGIFTRDMQPKPAYHVLNDLINLEWRTNTAVAADADGTVRFRGFRGRYRLSYKQDSGEDVTMVYELA